MSRHHVPDQCSSRPTLNLGRQSVRGCQGMKGFRARRAVRAWHQAAVPWYYTLVQGSVVYTCDPC